MQPRTARNGKADWSLDGTTFTEIPEVRDVKYTPKTPAKEYASSSTQGATKRLEGVDDFTGSITVYIEPDHRFDASTFGIRSGASGFFRVYEARTDVPFILPVYLDDVDYNIDVEKGEIIGAEIKFSGNGPIVYPS